VNDNLGSEGEVDVGPVAQIAQSLFVQEASAATFSETQYDAPPLDKLDADGQSDSDPPL
jgi:hypothetical protein